MDINDASSLRIKSRRAPGFLKVYLLVRKCRERVSSRCSNPVQSSSILPIRQEQIISADTERPLRNDPVGDVADGVESGRCSAKSASSTNSAGKAYEDKRPRDRYATKSARLLGVLDERLAGRDWIMGAEYSIADISLLGWVRNLIGFYEARELVGFDRFLDVQAWLDRGLARPAVQRGLQVTAPEE